jgi:O-acetylhomoserine/O-acetylserine sulfhydrylase-like pyridoxal-dependent enzyme
MFVHVTALLKFYLWLIVTKKISIVNYRKLNKYEKHHLQKTFLNAQYGKIYFK